MKNKKIKVFSLPWHVSNQYEMLKLSFEWHYLIQHTRKWSDTARPLPDHVKWELYYEPGKYDLAILHVDQQCISPKIAFGKSTVFREIRAQIHDIPIIVVNHGTPVYPEVFIQMAAEEGYRETEEAGEEWGKKKMKELLKGIDAIVVNSHEAQRQWGFGEAIIHGLDKDEWYDLPKEPRAITVISPAGMGEKYYGRTFFRQTRDVLKEKYGFDISWVGENGNFAPNWHTYREYIGKSLVYFNPTIGSPMPRSRTVAMISGACVVTTKFHDADTFIKNGENGFICKLNPQDAADKIAWCLTHYKESVAIGKKGRETAIKLFDKKRFQRDWINLVERVLGRKI